MDVSILDIDNQRLSSIIVNYYTCKSCGYADSDIKISLRGNPCGHCGVPSEGGMILFKLGVYIMVDLMQEYYHLKPAESKISIALGEDRQNHLLAIIIFYCSLGELLLEGFLTDFMYKLDIPVRVQDDLLRDISMEGRLGLFHTLTEKKFSQVVKDLDKQYDNDYSRVINTYKDIRDKRNLFLHAGNMFIIDKKIIEQCILDSPILINIFVKLHNIFIAK